MCIYLSGTGVSDTCLVRLLLLSLSVYDDDYHRLQWRWREILPTCCTYIIIYIYIYIYYNLKADEPVIYFIIYL
jgi:hypothetical protein